MQGAFAQGSKEYFRTDQFHSVKASLDTALGVALVPYFPPKHHTRAARLLNGVLQTEATNVEARFARAQIFQTAQNWSEARRSFQMILDLGGDEKEMVAAREELAWCFVNEGRLEKGREILEEVVEMRDSRWEQSGKEDEALPRARAWYRLGRTEWMIGGKWATEDYIVPGLTCFCRRRGQTACRRLVHGVHSSSTFIRPCIFVFGNMLHIGQQPRHRSCDEVLPESV